MDLIHALFLALILVVLICIERRLIRANKLLAEIETHTLFVRHQSRKSPETSPQNCE
jgi:hypothetical protein